MHIILFTFVFKIVYFEIKSLTKWEFSCLKLYIRMYICSYDLEPTFKKPVFRIIYVFVIENLPNYDYITSIPPIYN